MGPFLEAGPREEEREAVSPGSDEVKCGVCGLDDAEEEAQESRGIATICIGGGEALALGIELS